MTAEATVEAAVEATTATAVIKDGGGGSSRMGKGLVTNGGRQKLRENGGRDIMGRIERMGGGHTQKEDSGGNKQKY